MANVFYDHIVICEEVTQLLLPHKLSPDELEELTQLIDQILHHHVLNTVLSHLPREHHAEFVTRLHETPHDPQLLHFIQERVTVNISLEIKKQADRIKKDLVKDIKKSSLPRSHRR